MTEQEATRALETASALLDDAEAAMDGGNTPTCLSDAGIALQHTQQVKGEYPSIALSVDGRLQTVDEILMRAHMILGMGYAQKVFEELNQNAGKPVGGFLDLGGKILKSSMIKGGADVRKAQYHLQQAISIDSTDPWPYLGMGQTYELSGNPNAARQAYQQGLQHAQGPGDEKIRKELSKQLARLGVGPGSSAIPTGGAPDPRVVAPGYVSKSKTTAGLLGIFLGGLGIHRFYLGFTNIGIAQIIVTAVTFGFGALWGLVEGILILTGRIDKDAAGNSLVN